MNPENNNGNNCPNCNSSNCQCNNAANNYNGSNNSNNNYNNNGWNNNYNNNGWNNNNVPPYQNGGNVPPYNQSQQNNYQLSDTARSGLNCIKAAGIIEIILGVLMLLGAIGSGIFVAVFYGAAISSSGMADTDYDAYLSAVSTYSSILSLVIFMGSLCLPVLIAGIVLTVLSKKHLKQQTNNLTTVGVLAIIFGGILGIIGGIIALVGKNETNNNR